MKYKKALFVDIQLGASGDMLVGSLLDTGIDPNKLKEKLLELNLSSWNLTPEKITRHSMNGTLANIECMDDIRHRNLNDIKTIIDKSSLNNSIKTDIICIFSRLAEAEAKVHGAKIEEIHFHEIGALDSVIDISAFCILKNIMGIEEIFFNEFPHGSGTITSAHGEIPVPVPAVIELSRNFDSTLTDKPGELITPTAAAILTTLGKQKKMPVFKIIQSGIGFGTRIHPFPSYTRSFIIQTQIETKQIQIECNIDDMNPQIYPYIIERLIDKGALDAYLTPVSMKKGRPGTLLTVIAGIDKEAVLKEIIYRETTTLGLRIFNITREKISRSSETIKISGEEIGIKIGCVNNIIYNIQPEFEDCKKAAKKLNMPVKEVISQAVYEYKLNHGNN